MVSDSGTITEEASLLDLPAVTIRYAHERPEGMDEGTLIMSGLKSDEVMAAVGVVCKQRAEYGSMRTIPDYLPENVSAKIARIVLSYTGYVNRVVWRK